MEQRKGGLFHLVSQLRLVLGVHFERQVEDQGGSASVVDDCGHEQLEPGTISAKTRSVVVCSMIQRTTSHRSSSFLVEQVPIVLSQNIVAAKMAYNVVATPSGRSR